MVCDVPWSPASRDVLDVLAAFCPSCHFCIMQTNRGVSCHTVSSSPFIFFLAFVSCTVSMTGHGRYDRDASCASHRVLPSIPLFTIPLLRRLVVCRGGEVPFLALNGARKVPPPPPTLLPLATFYSTAFSYPKKMSLLQACPLLPRNAKSQIRIAGASCA